MSDLSDLQDAVATLSAAVATEDGDIKALIAKGTGAASAADLQAITTSVNTVVAAVNVTDAAVKAANA